MSTIRNIFAAGLIGLLGCNEKQEVEIALPVHEVGDVQLLPPPTIIQPSPSIEEKIDTPSQTEICTAVEKAKTEILYDASLPQIGPVITELEKILPALVDEKRTEFLKNGHISLRDVGFKPSRNGGAFVKGYNVLGPSAMYTSNNLENVFFNISLHGNHNSYSIQLGCASDEYSPHSGEFAYMNEANIKITKIHYKPAGRNGKVVYEHILAAEPLVSGRIQAAVRGTFYDASLCDETVLSENQKGVSDVLNSLVELWNTLYKK